MVGMKKFFLLFGLVVLVNGSIFAKDILDDKKFQKLCGESQKSDDGTCLCFKGAKGNTGSKHWNGEAILTAKGFDCPKGNWGFAITKFERKWSSYRGTGETVSGSSYGKYDTFFKNKDEIKLPLEKDAEFQKFCNVSTDFDTATDLFCSCAGQFKDFSKAYSEEDLIENPEIVSKPTSLENKFVEFADPYIDSQGFWTCPASFFGVISAKNAYYNILGRSMNIGKGKSKSNTTTKKTNTTNNKSKSVKEKLLELKKLFDEGLITKDVYEKKQLELLE